VPERQHTGLATVKAGACCTAEFSGRAYAWSVDSEPDYADAPDWLYELISSNSGETKTGKPLEHWHAKLTEPIRNGERNTTLASIAGKLIHAGLDVILTYDLLACVNAARCEQPLSPHCQKKPSRRGVRKRNGAGNRRQVTSRASWMGMKIVKQAGVAAWLIGIAVLIGLTIWPGLDAVGHRVASVGWGIVLVVMTRAVTISVAGAGWWLLFP
jgi:hypothetical protein